MARKTIRVSDQSGNEIAEGKGATVRITFADARKGVRELDLTDAEAEQLGGRPVARRGRRPWIRHRHRSDATGTNGRDACRERTNSEVSVVAWRAEP